MPLNDPGALSSALERLLTHPDESAQIARAGRENVIRQFSLDRMLGITEDLTEEDWGGLLVPHKYMGPLPVFFYPLLCEIFLEGQTIGKKMNEIRVVKLDGTTSAPEPG